MQTEQIFGQHSGLEAPKAKKIFFVEDDRDIVEIYREALQSEGFDFESAEDGLRAIKMVRNVKPDVIILDLLMPKLNGVDVVKYVRAHSDIAGVPIVILSNAFMSDLVQRAADAGANIGLLKSSCSPRKLINVINSVLNGDECDTRTMSLLAAPLRDNRGALKSLASAPEIPKAPPTTLIAPTEERRRGPATEMRHAFTVTEARTIADMRNLWQGVLTNEGSSAQKIATTELWTKMRGISNSAAAAGCVYISRFTGAMEALLRDSIDSQVNPTFARMLTISEGINFVKYLFNATGGVNFGSPTPNSVLVVDPDVEFISTLERAFANVNLRIVHAVDSMSASILLERNSFDLMLLETDLPEMSGYNFCIRAHAMPAHAKMPVMFLTSNFNTDSRPRAELCGGKEIFGKPVLASELIVKMLMQIMHDEIDAAKPA